MITRDNLRAIAGAQSNAVMAGKIADAFNKYAAAYGVTNKKRITQFLANVSHETGGFSSLSENMNYSVSGLLKTFGRHRISDADARACGRQGARSADQRRIANLVYGGAWGRKNLGNIQPNDGWDLRGSGPGQVTGRANFQKASDDTGIDFIGNPDLMRDPDIGMRAALMLWQKWGLNELADRGETVAIRERWNGGRLGLAEVRKAVERGMALNLKVSAANVAPSLPAVGPIPSIKPSKEAGAAAAILIAAITAAGAYLSNLPCSWLGFACGG